MNFRPLRWNINDDADAELRYWMNELVLALEAGAAFALAAGILIALLPAGEGHAGARFLRDFWPLLVECAFWLGMLLAMVWSAVKRLASALYAFPPNALRRPRR